MYKYVKNVDEFTNVVKLADDTILALSSLDRGQEVSSELLERGINLLEYLEELFREIKIGKGEDDYEIFRGVRDDKMLIKESKIDLDQELEKSGEMKKMIRNLISSPSSRKSEDIKKIKEYLIKITMPYWQRRTSTLEMLR